MVACCSRLGLSNAGVAVNYKVDPEGWLTLPEAVFQTDNTFSENTDVYLLTLPANTY